MFFIDKIDKPNFLEKNFKIHKVIENTIYVPIYENIKENQFPKLALKTVKTLKNNSNSKKVVLSKEIQKNKKYIDYLNYYELEICDGKFLYELLIPEIIQFIISKKNIKNINISILINDLTEVAISNIIELAKTYKSINIVTNHVEKFERIVKKLENDEGIIVTITNNKRKSLMKSQIILNIDFPNELINKYNLKDDAIIINIKQNAIIKRKRFGGTYVNNYEIDFREDMKDFNFNSEKFYMRDIYESMLYKRQNIDDLKKKLKQDNVKIVSIY